MKKKSKPKKSSQSARAAIAESAGPRKPGRPKKLRTGIPTACCTVGGPPPAEYLNDSVRGVAPSRQRYPDVPRHKTMDCRNATHVTAAQDIRYDGRLHSGARLFTSAQIRAFRRTRRTSHQIRELVKGLIAANPDLQTASREQLFAEAVYQLLQASGKRLPVVPKNWADAIRFLVDYMPLGAVTTAASIMRRHDRDIEFSFNDKFWAKNLPGRAAPVSIADRQLNVHDLVRRKWQAGARSARTQVTTCNRLKQRHPCALYKAPKLDVRHGRNRPLTDTDILGI